MARKSKKNKMPQDEEMPKRWRTGSYCRLSDDDRSGNISNYIEKQSILNREYISKCPDMIYVAEFIDDGKSGTDFSREGFENMMKEIMEGHIDCIVVKDLSRLGRNYIDTEDYITKIFPFLNTRLIAINDDIDTAAPEFEEKMLQMRLKNLINDLYAKQVSQNVGQAFDKLGEKGMFHGPVPPYGYLINNDDPKKRFLVIDKAAADVVREIFTRYLKGDSLYAITKYLNEDHILPPMRHFSDLGLFRSNRHVKESKWYKSTVRLILENPAYCGCLVKRKHNGSLYKGIPHHKIPKEEWGLIYDRHEAVISVAEYNAARKLLETRKIESEKREAASASARKKNIYAGKMRCGCCGKPLMRSYYLNRKGERNYYQCCEGYKYKSTAGICKQCYMNEDPLGEMISRLLTDYTELFTEKARIKNALALDIGLKKDTDRIGQRILNLENIKSQMMEKRRKLYSDLKQGVIDKEEYLYAKKEYENDERRADEQIDSMRQEMKNIEKKQTLINRWQTYFEKAVCENVLSKELIDGFISNITVINSSHIEIRFAFQDIFCRSFSQSERGREAVHG